MVRAVVFRIYTLILMTGVLLSQPVYAASDIHLDAKDLAFLKAVKQETLSYVNDQMGVAEAFKKCIDRNICDAKFQVIDSTHLPFQMVFESKDELLNLIRRLHTKFRILTALRNKTMYDSIQTQGLAFLSPMTGLPVMRFTSYGPYGKAEMARVFKIIKDDEATKQEFKDKFNIDYRKDFRQDYHTDYNIEMMAIDTYELQMNQMLAAIPLFHELMFAEVGRRETELSEAAIVDRLNVFIRNLEKTKATVEAIASDNVVDTLMFPTMVSQVLANNPGMSGSYDKLSAYALARKNLFTAFVDKFTNAMTWALVGCVATSIIVPKAAPLIMGVCGTLGLGTITVMAAKTIIEIDRISPLVRTGLIDPSNLSHLHSVLTHQILFAFILGSGAVPSILRLAQASTFKEPVKYYSQVIRDLSSRTTSQQAWRTYAREHIQDGKQELAAIATRFAKNNAKDLAARVPASAVYQAYKLVPMSLLVQFDLFEIFTLSDSLRLQMALLTPQDIGL